MMRSPTTESKLTRRHLIFACLAALLLGLLLGRSLSPASDRAKPGPEEVC